MKAGNGGFLCQRIALDKISERHSQSPSLIGLKLHHWLVIVAVVCDRRWITGTALTKRRNRAISNWMDLVLSLKETAGN